MGVWVLHDSEARRAVLYDSTSELALPEPSFIGVDAAAQAWSFLGYLATEDNAKGRVPLDLVLPRPTDPRAYSGVGLASAYTRWCDVAFNRDGSLNDYGWALFEWQQAAPSYGEPTTSAPEPAAEAVR